MANERSESVGKLESQIKSAQSVVSTFKSDLKDINDSLTQLNTKASQFRDDFKKATAQDAKNTKELKERNALRKQAIDLEGKEEVLLQKKMRTETQIAREAERIRSLQRKQSKEREADLKKEAAAQQRTVKSSIQAKKAILAEANAFKILEKQTNSARERFKRLAAQHGINSKQAIKAELTFKRLDKQLRKVNNAARDGRRDVGRYGKAWTTAQSALARVGVGIGIGFIAREGIEVLNQFEESAADMAKTLNITTEAAKDLSLELIKMDTGTSIDDLQKIAAIGGQMGISKGEIIGFTESIDKLNVALGDEFTGGAEEITKEIGGLRNVLSDFKTDDVADDVLKIGNALNVLGASGNATSPIVTDFAKRISGVGTPLGLSTGQILGTSAALQELGVNAERGGTATGKILQRMTLDTVRFAQTAGLSVEEYENMLNTDLMGAFQAVLKGTQKFQGDSAGLSKELSELKLTGSGASEVFLKLGGNLELMNEKIDLSSEALGNTDSILEEFNTKNETLGATIGYATNRVKEWFLELDKSNGITLKLKDALKFLADNFGTILSVGAKLLTFFGIYKAQMLVMNALNGKFGSSLKGVVRSFKNLSKGGGRAVVTIKNLGKALSESGAVMTAAIALVWELYEAWANVAFKTQQYENFLKRQEAAETKQGEFAAKRSEDRGKEFQKRVNEIKIEISERKKAGEDASKLDKEEKDRIQALTEARKKAVDSDIAEVRKRKNAALEELEAVRKARKKLFDEAGGEDRVRTLAGTQSVTGGGLLDRLNELDAKFNSASATVAGLGAKITIYKDESDSLTQTLVDQTIEINNNTDANDKNGESKEKQISLLRKIEDAENDLIKNDLERAKQRLDIEVTRSNEDIDKAVANEEEKARLKELVIQQYLRDINKLEEDAAKEREERDAERLKMFADKIPDLNVPEAEDFGLGIEDDYNRKRLELLKDQSNSDKEVAEESMEYRIELLNREIDIRKNLGLETLDFELELEEIKRQKQDENRERWVSRGKEALNNLGKAAESYTNDRIKEQDKIIASEEALLASLQENAGTYTQEQAESIAAQQQKVAEAQEEKIRLEKQKQAVEFATAAITTFTSALEGGATVPEAFADVALSQAGLELILNQLPKFFHGAEDTGTVGIFSDQYGPVTGVTHKNEGVLNEELNTKKKKSGLTNESMLDAAIRMTELENNPSAIDSDAYMQMMFMPQLVTPVYDDDRVVEQMKKFTEKMEENTKAIRNIEIPRSEMGRIIGDGFSVLDKNGKGNTLETFIRAKNNN